MRKYILWLLLALTSTAFGDGIDDAAAKARGVPVEVIQLENAKARIAELEKDNAALKKQLADIQRPVAAAAKPNDNPPPKPPFKPKNTFITRAQSTRPTNGGQQYQALAARIDKEIATYLAKHPEIPDTTAEAMYAGTPKPGMTEEQTKIFCGTISTLTENIDYKEVVYQVQEGEAYKVAISKTGLILSVTSAGGFHSKVVDPYAAQAQDVQNAGKQPVPPVVGR